MKKRNRLYCIGLVLVLSVSLLLTGCTTKENPSEQGPSVSSMAPTPLQNFFLYATQSSLGTYWNRCEAVLKDSGYTALQDGDTITIHDPQNPYSSLSITRTHADGYDLVSAMRYTLVEGGETRTAKIVRTNDGAPSYYIDEHLPVQSIDELRAYLHITPTAETSDFHSDLFSEFYVSVANGSISYRMKDLKPIAYKLGFFYQIAEGSIVFYDLEHPESFIYGDLTQLDNADESTYIANWGYHLESDYGIRDVNIRNIATSATQYYVGINPLNEGTQVQTLDEMLAYITSPQRTPAEQSLGTLRQQTNEAGCYSAVAYLGNADEVESLLQNSSAAKDYPFIGEFADVQRISAEGEDVYCIVPAHYNDTYVTVTALSMDSSGNLVTGKTLYSGWGEPIILRCNISDIMPNVLVTITNGNSTYRFSPYISLRDGSLAFQTEHPNLFVFGSERAEENGKWVEHREFSESHEDTEATA